MRTGKKVVQEFHNKQLEEQVYGAIYHDQACIVCSEKINVRAASNGYMHHDCESKGTTGKVVYPTPDTSVPIELIDGIADMTDRLSIDDASSAA